MKRLITSLFMAILMTATSFFPLHSVAVAQGIYVTPRIDTLNVRAGPGTNYAIVGALRRGEQVRVLGEQNATWLKIDYRGVERYVFSSYITKLLPTAGPAVPVRLPPAPTPVPGPSRQGRMPQVTDYANYNDYLKAYYAYIGSSPAPNTSNTYQPPTVIATPTQATNCSPSYPTVCIPPAPPDLDCKDVPYRRFVVLPPDPHRFDRDRDGIGCEKT